MFAKLASETLVPELSAAAAGSRVRQAFKACMHVVWMTAVPNPKAVQ